MRWKWIMLLGAIAPTFALVLGLAGSRMFNAIAALDPSGVAGPGRWADWSAGAGFAAFLALWMLFVWRLKAWESGRGPACLICGGPLGRVREGKRYYGKQLSDYRRCYNCGKLNSGHEGR